MDALLKDRLRQWADTYNNPEYFREDPIAFPREFASRGAGLKDIEIAAVFAAHFAWGRRSMIVRDCTRLFDEMGWRPYDYVMKGCWRCDAASAHRTVRWSEVASICARLKEYYSGYDSLERLDAGQIRTGVYGQKEDPKAANKKINMMRRWMVRRDGKVDLGLWKDTDPATLVIPLDVHVYQEAEALGLTDRRQKDLRTAVQITDAFREIWPADPCLGDFALFGYGINK
ncbi:MAG: DUF2400 domain-containing protein [Bacteroidales bacterium]|nr:DUF2400 domain-containing protein [Bacteroidales bacterium]